MKSKLFVALLLLASAEVIFAQKHTVLEPVVLECRYLEQQDVDTVTHRMVPDTMVLQIGHHSSAFFSKDRVFVDSLWHTPNGFNKWINLMRQYLNEGHYQDLLSNDGKYYYLDYPEAGKITVVTELNRKGVEYVEDREPLAWEFRDSVKTVLGYECHLAEADFRGRHWSAWYTLEVPVSAGPWKLWGLPGLICEAYDDSHFFSYTLVSLTPDPNQDIVIYRWYKKYEQTTRFQLFDAISRNSELMKEDARQNGLSEMAREGHGPGHKELDWKR